MEIKIGQIYTVHDVPNINGLQWGGSIESRFKERVVLEHTPIIVRGITKKYGPPVVVFNILSENILEFLMYVSDAKKYFRSISYNKLKII